jgi:hypothetical protein
MKIRLTKEDMLVFFKSLGRGELFTVISAMPKHYDIGDNRILEHYNLLMVFKAKLNNLSKDEIVNTKFGTDYYFTKQEFDYIFLPDFSFPSSSPQVKVVDNEKDRKILDQALLDGLNKCFDDSKMTLFEMEVRLSQKDIESIKNDLFLNWSNSFVENGFNGVNLKEILLNRNFLSQSANDKKKMAIISADFLIKLGLKDEVINEFKNELKDTFNKFGSKFVVLEFNHIGKQLVFAYLIQNESNQVEILKEVFGNPLSYMQKPVCHQVYQVLKKHFLGFKDSKERNKEYNNCLAIINKMVDCSKGELGLKKKIAELENLCALDNKNVFSLNIQKLQTIHVKLSLEDSLKNFQHLTQEDFNECFNSICYELYTYFDNFCTQHGFMFTSLSTSWIKHGFACLVSGNDIDKFNEISEAAICFEENLDILFNMAINKQLSGEALSKLLNHRKLNQELNGKEVKSKKLNKI